MTNWWSSPTLSTCYIAVICVEGYNGDWLRFLNSIFIRPTVGSPLQEHFNIFDLIFNSFISDSMLTKLHIRRNKKKQQQANKYWNWGWDCKFSLHFLCKFFFKNSLKWTTKPNCSLPRCRTLNQIESNPSQAIIPGEGTALIWSPPFHLLTKKTALAIGLTMTSLLVQ